MQTCIDEVVCWSKMIFSITTVDKREVLQMCIIIEGKIVEHNDTEKLQNFYGRSLNILANDVCTFLITQITILEITSSIGVCQSCKRSKIFLTILLSIRTHIKTSAKIGCFTILEETNAICCRFYMIDLRGKLHSQMFISRTILAVKQGV